MRISFFIICCLISQFGFAQSEIAPKDVKLQTKEEVYQSKERTEDIDYTRQNNMLLMPSNKSGGNLTETKDERIDLLIQDYTDNKKTMGYRVQLFSGNSRWEAVKVKSDFLKKFRNTTPPHLVYQSPNFKIRVGDYRNRLEAQKHLELYKIDYPSAFVVKDEIKIVIPK